MQVAELDVPVVFRFKGRNWVSSRNQAQAATMRWCLDLDEGHLLQIPMKAEVELVDAPVLARRASEKRSLTTDAADTQARTHGYGVRDPVVSKRDTDVEF
jgi:hypothetical protein